MKNIHFNLAMSTGGHQLWFLARAGMMRQIVLFSPFARFILIPSCSLQIRSTDVPNHALSGYVPSL